MPRGGYAGDDSGSSLVALELLIAPDAHLDGTFAAFNHDACEMFDVYGRNFTFEPATQE